MQSKGNAPTARQKRWYDAVAKLDCIECKSPAQIHHCVGATGKHNKIHIGHWFILPLCPKHHEEVHAMGRERKAYEKLSFENVYGEIEAEFEFHPADLPSKRAYLAIMDYHR